MKIKPSNEDMKKTGAYKITNTLNGKFYVGGTGWCFKYRLNKHIQLLRDNSHPCKPLQKEWLEHKEDVFEFEILEVSTKEDVITVEQKWLDILKPWDNGYNVGRKSIPSKGYLVGETKENWLKSIRTPEHRKKLSKIQKRVALENARPIAVYTRDGEYLRTFDNIVELVEYSKSENCDLPMVLNKTSKGKTLRREHINRVLCGMRKHMKGLTFKYAD